MAEASNGAADVALMDVLTLAIGEELLMLCAGIEHALQLQLTQLALFNCLSWKAVP